MNKKTIKEKHPNKTKFEKKRIIEKENTKPNSNLNSSSRPVRTGHQRPIVGRKNDDTHRPTGFEEKKQIENKEHRTVSSMLRDIKYLTHEERDRASGMLEELEREQNKAHNRGNNRGRGR